MLRPTLFATLIALAPTVQAGTVASCDALDAQNGGREISFDDANIDLDGEELVLRSGGAVLIRIDAKRNLFVSGRPVAVPGEARADLEAYVDGFRRLEDDATTMGKEGGKIAAHAVGGLVSVLFTSKTLDDYERNMEAEGAKMEQHADRLCRTVAALQRTEQALQQRIPAFPNFIAPAKPAL
jgi:hypothetical protein